MGALCGSSDKQEKAQSEATDNQAVDDEAYAYTGTGIDQRTEPTACWLLPVLWYQRQLKKPVSLLQLLPCDTVGGVTTQGSEETYELGAIQVITIRISTGYPQSICECLVLITRRLG